MPKHGLKILGLAVMAALGMMAFSAAAAQATLVLRHTAILLNGTFLGTGAGNQNATGVQEGTATLKIPAKNAEIQCAKGEVSEATVKNETDTKKNPEGAELPNASESGTAGMGEGKLTFSECNVFLSGVKSTPCTTAFNAANNGGKPSAKVLVLTLLHWKDTANLATHFLLVRLTPLTGTEFTTLEFGGTCSLPEKAKVTGSVTGGISFPMPYTDGKTIKAEFDTETAFGKELSTVAGTGLLFGANPAFIKGNIKAELASGANWGVM